MANTQITLNRDEISKAIFEYVVNHYPVRPEELSIRVFRGKVKEVIVDCELKK